MAIAWISVIFLLYRVGLHVIGKNLACECLGVAGKLLNSSAPLFLILYMLAGAITFFTWNVNVTRRTAVSGVVTTI